MKSSKTFSFLLSFFHIHSCVKFDSYQSLNSVGFLDNTVNRNTNCYHSLENISKSQFISSFSTADYFMESKAHIFKF